MSANQFSNLADHIQVLATIDPDCEKNDISVLLNKSQARLLIRKLKAALNKKSDLCETVIEVDQLITFRNPYALDCSHAIVTNVSGKITLDNY